MALNAICCCLGGREAAPTAAHYVSLDHQRRAQSCTVSNTLVSGEGCVLGSAAILQDRSFWEANVMALGYFAIGVANNRVKLTETRLGTADPPAGSWGIDSDTLLEKYELNAGDTIGVAFDMSDEKVLKYYHNGEYLSGQDVRGIKGETWPIVSVAGGATLQLNFGADEFKFPIPRGFDGVIAPRNLV